MWSKKYSIPMDASFQGLKFPKFYPIASRNNGEVLIFKKSEGSSLFYHDEAEGDELNEIKTPWVEDIFDCHRFSQG